ncbi:hypothetical protein KC19_8G117500 [Ceratodon purpureus]|uniref:Secreted protein n=1 Tax=Ceratodon purpureus TaxID=3225 RepID=A0A8T0H2F4_CERPU|nr:hypothetical protein KC19_8G117500 [Ceratodon purpureus]
MKFPGLITLIIHLLLTLVARNTEVDSRTTRLRLQFQRIGRGPMLARRRLWRPTSILYHVRCSQCIIEGRRSSWGRRLLRCTDLKRVDKRIPT